MARFALTIIFLIVFSIITRGQHSHGSFEYAMPEIKSSSLDQDVDRIRDEVEAFYRQCKSWDNGIILSSFEKITELHAKLKNMASYPGSVTLGMEKEYHELYNQYMHLYGEVVFARSLLKARTQKEKEWETTYFRLWKNILDKKESVEQLYLEKRVNSGSKSIGYDRENTLIRKRQLYFAWNEVYDAFLKDMKNIKQYEKRIDIENQILKLLTSAEELAFASTRQLEKYLKKSKTPQEKYDLIMNYK